MSKIFTTFFLLLIIYSQLLFAEAKEYLKIIPRSEWGANEEYRYWNSSYWAEIFKKKLQILLLGTRNGRVILKQQKIQ